MNFIRGFFISLGPNQMFYFGIFLAVTAAIVVGHSINKIWLGSILKGINKDSLKDLIFLIVLWLVFSSIPLFGLPWAYGYIKHHLGTNTQWELIWIKNPDKLDSLSWR